MCITSCAGFYTKSDRSSSYPHLKADELNVLFEMSFNNGDHFVDEIEIGSKALYENKINLLKEDIINSLKKENPGKKIIVLEKTDNVKGRCVLTVNFNEKSNSKSMLATGLTLGLWPYVDVREVTMKSTLSKNDSLISESKTTRKYKAVFSLFIFPLAPFRPIQKAEKEAWSDTYRETLSKIDFSKCD